MSTDAPPKTDRQRIDAEINRMNAETRKLIFKQIDETSRIIDETRRINEINTRYPWLFILAMVVPTLLSIIGVMGAIVPLVVAFHK